MHDQIEVKNLTIAFDGTVIQRDMNFSVKRGEIFTIMGSSGCGKSALLRHMVGLYEPAAGEIIIEGKSFWTATLAEQQAIMRHFGVLFQSGALWSAMTLAQNIALPLEQFTQLSPGEIAEIVSYKLALVGLAGFENFYPDEISTSMQKRIGLARAMALDPKILFFDEPLSGLDPVASRHLDDLILGLRDSLGTTIVLVTHELESIFAISDNAIFMDAESQSILAHGDPRTILRQTQNFKVRQFLTRSR
ncbi:MAG: ATP-binding cassette domain-containing protein [Pseudomonadota bacterium]|nr:ATP-binding cassette domain-containing protein [Pseudomonadota bacterium]